MPSRRGEESATRVQGDTDRPVPHSTLALAIELDCPLITADRRLFERARTDPRVRHLSRIGKLA
jgi:hypothetical protein